MMKVVSRQVRRMGVSVLNRVMVTDLVMDDGEVVGAGGFHTRSGDFLLLNAKRTILASGGMS